MNIQLQACIDTHGNVEPTSQSKAEFFGLYVGMPGSYRCICDIEDYEMAYVAGTALARYFGYDFVEYMLDEEVDHE